MNFKIQVREGQFWTINGELQLSMFIEDLANNASKLTWPGKRNSALEVFGSVIKDLGLDNQSMYTITVLGFKNVPATKETLNELFEKLNEVKSYFYRRFNVPDILPNGEYTNERYI